MGALQYVSTSALSLTLSGNTGVAPFLTLFVVGVIEKSDPTLLYMDGFVEKILASWPGLVAFGTLTVMEFVGKCVPVVDEIIDSALAVVVPLFSVLGSLASHGLYTAPASASEEPKGRRLEGEEESKTNGLLIFLQVILSTVGIFLALLVHLCLMVVRLLGEGCCTPCITAGEITWVITSVTICIFIVPIAIGCAILLFIAAGFGFKKWWEKRQKKKAEAAAAAEGAGGGGTGGEAASSQSGGEKKESKSGDEEEGKANAGDGLDAEQAKPNLGETSKTVEETLKEPLLP